MKNYHHFFASQAANALGRPTVTSWRLHDTAAARLVVGLSPLRVWWNGTRFHTHSGTLLGVPTSSRDHSKLKAQNSRTFKDFQGPKCAIFKHQNYRQKDISWTRSFKI